MVDAASGPASPMPITASRGPCAGLGASAGQERAWVCVCASAGVVSAAGDRPQSTRAMLQTEVMTAHRGAFGDACTCASVPLRFRFSFLLSWAPRGEDT